MTMPSLSSMQHALLPAYKSLRRQLAARTNNDDAAIRAFDRKFRELEDDQEVSVLCAYEQLLQEFDACLPLDEPAL